MCCYRLQSKDAAKLVVMRRRLHAHATLSLARQCDPSKCLGLSLGLDTAQSLAQAQECRSSLWRTKVWRMGRNFPVVVDRHAHQEYLGYFC